MDFIKVQEANAACAALLRVALDTPSVPLTPRAEKLLEHCLDMIDQMKTWPADRLEKAFRWLGYIQGVMESFAVADLETLKKMNAPNEADVRREEAAKKASPRKVAMWRTMRTTLVSFETGEFFDELPDDTFIRVTIEHDGTTREVCKGDLYSLGSGGTQVRFRVRG